MKESTKPWIFLLALVPLYLTWTFDHSLWNPDETRDGGIAAEMYRSGDYVVPKLNGVAFLEKPPLLLLGLRGGLQNYWARNSWHHAIARGAFRNLGCSLYFSYWETIVQPASRSLGCNGPRHLGAIFSNESCGSHGCGAGCLGGRRFLLLSEGIPNRVCIVHGAGFLCQRIFGSDLDRLRGDAGSRHVQKTQRTGGPHRAWNGHLCRFCGTVVLGIVERRGGTVSEVFLIDNHWKRFFSKGADHTEHFWFFYFLSFPVDFLPWTLLYLGHLRDLIRHPQKYIEPGPRRFLIIWFFGLLLFFCLSSSKRSIYLLPLFPAAALLGAAWLDEAISGQSNEKRVEKIFYIVAGVLAVLIAGSSFFLVPRLDRDKSFLPVCEAIQVHAGNNAVIGYNLSEMERGVFGFYLNGPLRNPTDPDQLKRMMEEIRPKPFCLIINRNRIDEIKAVLEKQVRLVFEYRPDKRTRSYLIYMKVEAPKVENTGR